MEWTHPAGVRTGEVSNGKEAIGRGREAPKPHSIDVPEWKF